MTVRPLSVSRSDGATRAPDLASTTSHLDYLEGVRAFAALIVVLFHAYGYTLLFCDLAGAKGWARDILGWMLPGRGSVVVFIVLSGYLLMRPTLASGGHMKRGIADYLRRRAVRILPPYYVALLLSVSLIVAAPSLMRGARTDSSTPRSALNVTSVTSHILLLHNLSSATALTINGPMWTVATEWQLYFAFPILLLPLWRRTGNVVTILAGLGVPLAFVWATGRGTSAALWFAGPFAAGMAAAAVSQRDPFRIAAPSGDRVAVWYGWMSILLLAAYAVVTGVLSLVVWRSSGGFNAHFRTFWIGDCLIGGAAACGLVYAAAFGHASVIIRALSTPALVQLGRASYSLYLIHDPLLVLERAGLDLLHLAPAAAFLIIVVFGVPCIVCATFLFHWSFERPFMNWQRVRGTTFAPAPGACK